MDEEITLFTNKLCTYEDKVCLWSPDLKNPLNNIQKGYIVVAIDKTNGNISLGFNRSFACYCWRTMVK